MTTAGPTDNATDNATDDATETTAETAAASVSASPSASTPPEPRRAPSRITGDPVGRRCDVLIADDTTPAREILASLLRQSVTGITIEQARDGREALVTWRMTQPRITFLDIDMPNQDGLGVLKAIRSTSPNAFVAIVSGNSSSQHVKAALEAGANGFVVKPFKPQRIVDVLERYRKVTGHALTAS
jgi:two-component system chemotaxis response regulator CheY